MTREQLVELAREAVAGVNRPTYCANPPAFDPHEWVLDAMLLAYKAGLEGSDKAAVAYLLDRAAQYKPGSGSLIALEDVAVQIAHGEHADAWSRGELEDLRARVERAMAGRSS